eukprot:182288-Chlamydomonas_euryale.AAC.1
MAAHRLGCGTDWGGGTDWGVAQIGGWYRLGVAQIGVWHRLNGRGVGACNVSPPMSQSCPNPQVRMHLWAHNLNVPTRIGHRVKGSNFGVPLKCLAPKPCYPACPLEGCIMPMPRPEGLAGVCPPTWKSAAYGAMVAMMEMTCGSSLKMCPMTLRLPRMMAADTSMKLTLPTMARRPDTWWQGCEGCGGLGGVRGWLLPTLESS